MASSASERSSAHARRRTAQLAKPAVLGRLENAEVRALQQASGNQAVQRLLAQREGSQTTTITEERTDEERPRHLVLKLRGRGSAQAPGQTATSPEPDPDPGGGGSSTVTEDEGNGPPPVAAVAAPTNTAFSGVGQAVGGNDIIKFNGKSYQFMLMNANRLSRLLQAIEGTPDAKQQVGAYAAAHRQLRALQKEKKPQVPLPSPTRKEEARAASELRYKLGMVFEVGNDVKTSKYRALLKETDTLVLTAIRTGTALKDAPSIDEKIRAMRTLYCAHLLAAKCVFVPAGGGFMTLTNTCTKLEDLLGEQGIPNRQVHRKTLKGLKGNVDRWEKLEATPLTVVELRDETAVVVNDLQVLCNNVGDDLKKGATQKKSAAVDWTKYHGTCDAHSQVVLDANPEIVVVTTTSLAALRKARDLVDEVNVSKAQFAAAARAIANSASFLGGNGKTTEPGGKRERVHVRLTQGGTQIRLEVLITTRYVIDKDIHFIEFLQVNYGHASGVRSGTLNDVRPQL